MKTTQDIDQLFEMMNDSLNEDITVPETDLEEMDKKYQEDKIKENRKIRNRLVFFGIVFIAALIFGKDPHTKINIILFLPFLVKMIWINHQGQKALREQNKAVSFTEFEHKKKQITEIFFNQYKRLRTPIYLAVFIGACANLYYIIEAHDIFDKVGVSILTLIGALITITAVQGLMSKYKKQN